MQAVGLPRAANCLLTQIVQYRLWVDPETTAYPLSFVPLCSPDEPRRQALNALTMAARFAPLTQQEQIFVILVVNLAKPFGLCADEDVKLVYLVERRLQRVLFSKSKREPCSL